MPACTLKVKYLQKINNNLRYCGNKLLRLRTFFAHSHVLPKKFARQDHFTQIFAQLTKRLGTAVVEPTFCKHYQTVIEMTNLFICSFNNLI